MMTMMIMTMIQPTLNVMDVSYYSVCLETMTPWLVWLALFFPSADPICDIRLASCSPDVPSDRHHIRQQLGHTTTSNDCTMMRSPMGTTTTSASNNRSRIVSTFLLLMLCHSWPIDRTTALCRLILLLYIIFYVYSDITPSSTRLAARTV
jgi:hypothetical protein